MTARPGPACRCALAAAALILSLSFAAAAEERVSFLNKQGEQISAVYAPPPGGATTPAPAVIMLHGCGGLFTKSGNVKARERAWMELFAAEGWALLLPDSFGSRGYGSLCKTKDRPVKPEVQRPFDTLAALTWLEKQPGIAPSKIALMGWSNGAMTGLHTIRKGADTTPPDRKSVV